jgi:hypothetical protein
MTKTLSTIALLGIGGFAAYYLWQNQKYGHSPATAKQVTNTGKGSINSSPIQTGRVAAIGVADPLKWIGSITNRAANLIPSNLANGSAPTNWRIPFGNPESQAAASNAPKATNVSNYRPSAWAPVARKFRSGV